MNTVKLSDIFKGNFLSYVTRYKENIQSLLDEYDIVIFMARKAICFYESMIVNGEIKKTNCEVYSSRIIDYNIIQKFKEKKIAIVDDVVVKGTSINRVISIFGKENIEAYVLVVACEASFPNTLGKDINFEMCNSYVTLNQADIYSFAGLITEYIEASMCSLNTDQPIYSIDDLSNHRLDKLLVDYNSIDVSCSLQQAYKIENKVIYLKNIHYDNMYTMLNFIPDDTILKIRIMSNGFRTIAIPFVLFPQLKNDVLDKLYSIIRSDTLDDFVCVDNERITRENKMKVVSYYYSEILAEAFCDMEDIEYEKVVDNDIFHFSVETKSLFGLKKNEINLHDESLCITVESVNSYSKFVFSDIIGLCYKSIINTNTNLNSVFFDSNNIPIEEIIITHSYFSQTISDYFESPELLASSVIDVFIDRGMMVPAIVHTENGIIRAYKMGEYSKLTRSQIELFAAMLYQYQGMIGTELGKTELEKLCVLFFNTAINRGIFSQQAHYEEDCYSICYSLFGPRVSLSNTIYSNSIDSALVIDFCKEKNGESIIKYVNGKYTINPIYTSNRMSLFALGFAHPYAAVSKMFNNTKEANESNKKKWNIFVHTYTQYLILKAIGNNKKNQYLSLCAEIYQLTKLKDDFFELKTKERKEYEWVLKGINSGLWKYWCYKNDALNKTSLLIFQKNPDIGSWLLSDVEPASDESTVWDELIENVACLLYRTAFLINEVLKTKNSLDYFNTEDDICGNQNIATKKTMFTTDSYSAEFREIRDYYEQKVSNYAQSNPIHFYQWARENLVELKNEARKQLDLCDQILETATTKYSSIQKLLVVYSSTGDFPINLSDGLNELYFEGIEDSKYSRVFGLSNKNNDLSDIAELLISINSYSNEYDLQYFVLDVGSDKEINYINNKVKDRCVAKILNCTIKSFLQRQVNKYSQLVFIGPDSYDASFNSGKHSIIKCDDSIYRTIESDMCKLIVSCVGTQLTVNIFDIDNNLITFEGDHIMGIGNIENVGNLTQMEGDNLTNITVQGDYTNIPNEMIELLEGLISRVDETEQKNIREAIQSAKKGNTNKFIQVMKSIGAHTLNVIENVASCVIYEWLHQNGIL